MRGPVPAWTSPEQRCRVPQQLPPARSDLDLVLGGRPFDRAAARREGLRDPDVTALVAREVVRHVVRGIYLDARVTDDLASRAACLRLRLPDDAVVGRLTAAWLFGVDACMPEERSRPPVVECIVPPGRQPLRRPGVGATSPPWGMRCVTLPASPRPRRPGPPWIACVGYVHIWGWASPTRWPLTDW